MQSAMVSYIHIFVFGEYTHLSSTNGKPISYCEYLRNYCPGGEGEERASFLSHRLVCHFIFMKTLKDRFLAKIRFSFGVISLLSITTTNDDLNTLGAVITGVGTWRGGGGTHT